MATNVSKWYQFPPVSLFAKVPALEKSVQAADTRCESEKIGQETVTNCENDPTRSVSSVSSLKGFVLCTEYRLLVETWYDDIRHDYQNI